MDNNDERGIADARTHHVSHDEASPHIVARWKAAMSNVRHPSLPRGLRILGWSGVLPFAAALAVGLLQPHFRHVALAVFIAYGAIILSFLGGARWGRALASTFTSGRYVEAVMPSLLAFSALLLVRHSSVALAFLAVGFAIWLLLDLRDPLWSPAYKRMRLGISLLVLALHAGWLLQ